MDTRLRHFAATFRGCFSKPQHRYFEIVLLALLLCLEAKTLTGLLRQVAARASLSGLSRFLAKAPWSTAAVAQTWRTRIDAQVTPLAQAAQARQRAARPNRAQSARHEDGGVRDAFLDASWDAGGRA